MNASQKNLVGAVGLVICLLILGLWTFQSCSGHDNATVAERDATNTTPSPSTTVSIPVNPSYVPPSPPQTANVPAAARDVAIQYITAKENRDAFYQQNVRTWVDSVTPITTDLARERWANLDPNGNSGAAWIWAHDARVKTQITDVTCTDNPELRSPQPDKFLSVRCTWLAVPVYADGSRVPPNLIDFTWEYNGPRGPAVLSMINNGGWKVSLDATGIAQ